MPSILATDGYKFSMAEAGWPLREETFYFSLRKNGAYLIPFDAKEMIAKLLPTKGDSVFEQLATVDEYPYLAENGYMMGGAFRAAMRDTTVDDLVIHAMPKGSRVYDGEPIFSVTGPSALVSWLEPLVLQLHYRIQLATLAEKSPDALREVVSTVTCERQKQIVLETLADLGPWARALVSADEIRVDEESYFNRVLERAQRLVQITGDPRRIFEVGLRAATCMEQHLIALRACKEAGIQATSNVYGAQQLDMKPVGTMGHEHVMRWGNDYEAFIAMRDRRAGPTSMLVDTYSTFFSGLPQAFRVLRDDDSFRERGHSIRFDSGNIAMQLTLGEAKAKEWNLRPRWIIEDGLDLGKTREFEELRRLLGIHENDLTYGYGGFLVDEWRDVDRLFDPTEMKGPLTRNGVSAVWKLSESNCAAVMKFGDGGKVSLPGVPIVWRRTIEQRGKHVWQTIIAQEGEDIEDAQLITNASADDLAPYQYDRRARLEGKAVVFSPETKRLVKKLIKQRRKMLLTWEDLS